MGRLRRCQWRDIFRVRSFIQSCVFVDSPSNELLLIADVLVVRIFHDVGNIHDEVHKRLCLLAQEVQEVAEAAVLRDHKHWTWWGNPLYYDPWNELACLIRLDFPWYGWLYTFNCNAVMSSVFSDLRRCRLQAGWQCSGGVPGGSGSSVQTSEPPSHLNGHWLQKQFKKKKKRGLNMMHFTVATTLALLVTLTCSCKKPKVLSVTSDTLNSKEPV